MIAIAIGLVAEISGPAWAKLLFEPSRVASYEELAAFLGAFAASIVLHEAGHLAAALVFRFDILGGSLGPLRVARFHGQWSLHFSLRNLFTGSVSAVPKRNRAWRREMLIVVAAGPAATLISGLAAGLIASEFRPLIHSWTSFFVYLGQLNLLIFALGLLPNGQKTSLRNDATIFYSLLQETPEAQEIFHYHVVTQLRIEGFRPRYYPEKIIRTIAAAGSRPEFGVFFAQAISSWALDRGDLDTAHAWNERAAQLSTVCDVRHQMQALAHAASFDLVIRNDRRSARARMADVNCEILSPPWFMHRAKAVRELADGNFLEANAEICRARYHFPNALPYYDFERMLLARLAQIAAALSRECQPWPRCSNL